MKLAQSCILSNSGSHTHLVYLEQPIWQAECVNNSVTMHMMLAVICFCTSEITMLIHLLQAELILLLDSLLLQQAQELGLRNHQ